MTAGIDAPDRRGRTGLDQHGRDLTGNPRVRIREVELLSSDWYVLRKTTFDYQHSDGHWSREHGIAAEGEDITTMELPFTEALAMIRSGVIADAKTIMLLQWAALDGPFRPRHPDRQSLVTQQPRTRGWQGSSHSHGFDRAFDPAKPNVSRCPRARLSPSVPHVSGRRACRRCAPDGSRSSSR